MVVGRYGAPRRQQQRTSTVDVVSCGIPGVRYVFSQGTSTDYDGSQ